MTLIAIQRLSSSRTRKNFDRNGLETSPLAEAMDLWISQPLLFVLFLNLQIEGADEIELEKCITDVSGECVFYNKSYTFGVSGS